MSDVINVRGVSAETKERLRLRAAAHGHSVAAEIRAILDQAVKPKKSLYDLFEATGDHAVELETPERVMPRGIDFG